MAIYDERKLRKVIDSLDRSADTTVAGYILAGTFAGAFIGFIAGMVIGVFGTPADHDSAGGMGALVGGFIGFLIGAVKGVNAAFDFRMKAETLSCLYQIEQNTRSPEDRQREAEKKAEQPAKPQRLFRGLGKH